MAGATRSIDINAPAEVLYDIIVDFQKYPEFLSDMDSVKVIRQDGEDSVVEFNLNLIKKISYTLNLTGSRPNKVRWNLRQAKLFKHNDGGWDIVEMGENHVRATYTIDLGFGLLVPKSISNRLIGTSLPATLEAFKRRAESIANQ